MRYQIPQFINIEDKVFGPFSFKQFIYLGGSAGIAFMLWRALPTFIAIPLIVVVAGLGLTLAFYKVNDRPFIHLLQSLFVYMFRSKIYLWRKQPPKPQKKSPLDKKDGADQPDTTPRLSESKLKELSWSLDVLDLEQQNSEEGH
jgi:hypothetical protein